MLNNLNDQIILKDKFKEILKNCILQRKPYVYIHYINSIPFYVGEGKNRRCLDFISRSNKWKDIVKNNKVEIKLKKCENVKEALKEEKRLTLKYRKTVINLIGRNGWVGSSNPNSKEKRKGESPLSNYYYRWDLEGNFIDEGYSSFYKNLGFNPTCISNSLNNKRLQYKNFIFTKEKVKPIIKKGKTSKRKVKATCKITEKVLIFNSINDTIKKGFRPKNVQQVCSKKKKSHKGYYWEYII